MVESRVAAGKHSAGCISRRRQLECGLCHWPKLKQKGSPTATDFSIVPLSMDWWEPVTSKLTQVLRLILLQRFPLYLNLISFAKIFFISVHTKTGASFFWNDLKQFLKFPRGLLKVKVTNQTEENSILAAALARVLLTYLGDTIIVHANQLGYKYENECLGYGSYKGITLIWNTINDFANWKGAKQTLTLKYIVLIIFKNFHFFFFHTIHPDHSFSSLLFLGYTHSPRSIPSSASLQERAGLPGTSTKLRATRYK